MGFLEGALQGSSDEERFPRRIPRVKGLSEVDPLHVLLIETVLSYRIPSDSHI